ncbi:hypothetical protein LTR53_011944 [Teratosphaeriaceae sp. CCFEE 6253]|nr:hypothetical protein LTR53_011944 [Teratosphaeriaceae sp. CCFEE 6253]
MADSKRNSTAGKVATPKAGHAGGSAPLPDTQEAIARAIGASVKVTTAAPESKTYDGALYTADPVTNLVVLNVRGPMADKSSQTGDYRVIPISQVQTFQLLSLADGNGGLAHVPSKMPELELMRLQKRCNDRVAALKDLEENRGKGVTKEAQAIFDSFKRINMPARWHNQEIIVHDSIIVGPPYRPEDCKAPKNNQEVLIRVKKALEGERKKLLERKRKTPTPSGPRKGG